MYFPGQIWEKPPEQSQSLFAISLMVAEVQILWIKSGLRASIVSGGSTPTAYQSDSLKHLTEIRPGTYIFNDMNTVAGGFCLLEDCAAHIIATVVSDAVPGQVVIDAGSKALTSDRRHDDPANAGHGCIIEYPQAKITKLSEEHGQVDVRNCDRPPKVGERVSVIPNHICPCVNLQDRMWWIEPGEPPRAVNIDARNGELIRRVTWHGRLARAFVARAKDARAGRPCHEIRSCDSSSTVISILRGTRSHSTAT